MPKRPTDKGLTPEDQKALIAYLKSLPTPKPVEASPEFNEYFRGTVLPALKAQALSELHRHDEFSPRLVSFMRDGSIGIVDVSEAMGGQFGSTVSKDITARIHQFSTRVPGVHTVVFCTETWMLHQTAKPGEVPQAYKGSLANHPDRQEAVMFNAIHYNPENGDMMQLTCLIEVLKVLGANRSRAAWAGNKFDTEIITDTQSKSNEGMRMTGRFVIGDTENPIPEPTGEEK